MSTPVDTEIEDKNQTVAQQPSILIFEEISDQAVGGKASGLADLIRMGLNVPAGFVVQHAQPGKLPEDLAAHYQSIGGGPVAVRSSAIGEDSADASFAGQYETILNVEGIDALELAIEQCLSSLTNERASSYKDEQTSLPDAQMCVVVQQMVDARAAGVLFTVDPVTHRRNHIVIDAVEGIGETLVSGEATPDHYILDRKGNLVSKDLVNDKPIISTTELQLLLSDSITAEEKQDEHLDMEWAIDHSGELFWLQARPITTLAADLNELDTELINDDDIVTICNISEALPGAVTPLTFSVTGAGLEIGMQEMQRAIGLWKERSPRFHFIPMLYGRLFINVSQMAQVSSDAVGNSPDDLALSLCGRLIPDLHVSKPRPLRERLPYLWGYIKLIFSANAHKRKLKKLINDLDLIKMPTAKAMWQMIDDNFEAIYSAHESHLTSSCGSGAMSPTLMGIISKGKEITEEHHAEAAILLAGADNIESADIALGAGRIQKKLLQLDNIKERFVDLSPEKALSFLTSSESGAAGTEYSNYIKRHGHRSISEMELRQKEWQEDPLPLIRSLQIPIREKLKQEQASLDTNDAIREAKLFLRRQNFIMRKFVKLAHQTVRNREETKSGMVKVTQIFKAAYRHLAQLMVEEKLLPDVDAIYFLTHSELGKLCAGEQEDRYGETYANIAVERRKVFPLQKELSFPDISTGVPQPLRPDLSELTDAKAIQGKPVSSGKVIGYARIVTSLDEAEHIKQDDILIAPITDIGWTPYFSIIQGLVTDIGSSLSHGAVVAREYGLPAVVKTDIGTKVFQTGDLVYLDGDSGIIRLANDLETEVFFKNQGSHKKEQ